MVKRKKHKREKYYIIITVCYILTMSATSKPGITQKRDMLSPISIAVPCPGVAATEKHDIVHYILRLSQDVSRLR